MGIFSRLFESTESAKQFKSVPVQTSEMLDEDVFWNLVQTSIDRSGGDQERQLIVLIQELEKLEPIDIVGFRLRTDRLLYDTYNSKFWCAGYIMNGGCSDDMFEYFRLWVISKGKAIYGSAKANPDSLVTQHKEDIEFYEFEMFWYVSLTAFKNVTGKELYDSIDYKNFQFGEGNYPQFEFDWSDEDPDTMKSLCPQLFERFLANVEPAE